MRAVLFCLSMVTSGAASCQTVYQCQGPNGQKVFQQAPCTDGKRLDVRPNLGGSLLGTPDQRQRAVSAASQQAAIERRDQEVGIAMQQGRVLLGMTESELVGALGSPTVVNLGNYGGSVSKQWVYRAKDRTTQYVYTREGVVTSMQWEEKPEPAPKVRVWK
jgi:hypothetical protein